ncbi:metallophosphoesterase [Alcanivorax sp.]|uniref:metallophosphoesterase n=1 Tax=Alcanivorax sp. TaxID=1872427 RepID=UPI0032D97217
MYDIIGDIHGFAEPLKQLLDRLGYQEIDGVWQHPIRKALFLGDYIDRGPQQVEVVRIVRAMVEADKALAIMGNHEFNAVAWASPNPGSPDAYLRPHNAKNRHQHHGFLEQVSENSPLHHEIIGWFKTLPVFLDLPEFRAVHACWHNEYLADLAPWLDSNNCLKEEGWYPASQKGEPVYAAIETLLKGLEIPLPQGAGFSDKDGHARTDIRARWWLEHAPTYRDLAMVPVDVIDRIPHELVPEGILPGYDNEKPAFVGHYWLTGDPAPLADHIACLDYSVVSARQGKLVAYRWDGRPLTKDNYIWVTR